LKKKHPLVGLDLATTEKQNPSTKSALDSLDLCLPHRSKSFVNFFFKPNSDPYSNPDQLFLHSDVLASILKIERKIANLEERIEFLKAPYQVASHPPTSFETLSKQTLLTMPRKTPFFFESYRPLLPGEIEIKEGGYGKVSKFVCGKSEFALKRAKLERDGFKEALKNEAFIYMLIGYHPNIAKIEAIALERLFIKFERDGTLSQYFEDRLPPTKRELMKISLDIASALDFLHEKKINYKDLKPNNILISRHPTFKALLCDFGISQRSSSDHKRTIRPEYAAPEVADERGHFLLSNKIDTWAFGILLFIITTNTHPFEHLNPNGGFEYLRKLREALLPGKKESLDHPFKPKSLKKFTCESDKKLISVATSCLLITPEQRPPMDEIILKLSQIKI
ncbi:MAG: serine/threonine-protein kinase, partial [Chlamydiae bacterium]|nr:serine/threonine-protein kinase [Chlamydiota bacterium]